MKDKSTTITIPTTMTTSCSSNSSIDFGLALVGGNVTDNRRNVPRSEIPNGQNIHGHDLALMSTNTASNLGPTTGCGTQIHDVRDSAEEIEFLVQLQQLERGTRAIAPCRGTVAPRPLMRARAHVCGTRQGISA